MGESVSGTIHANLARWFLHSEGLVMEFREWRVNLASTAQQPGSVTEMWDGAVEVARIEVPFTVARGLRAYLNHVLPQATRTRFDEDAKWVAEG